MNNNLVNYTMRVSKKSMEDIDKLVDRFKDVPKYNRHGKLTRSVLIRELLYDAIDRMMTLKPPPYNECKWCGNPTVVGKLICEHCRTLEPQRAKYIEQEELSR